MHSVQLVIGPSLALLANDTLLSGIGVIGYVGQSGMLGNPVCGAIGYRVKVHDSFGIRTSDPQHVKQVCLPPPYGGSCLHKLLFDRSVSPCYHVIYTATADIHRH